MSLRTIPHIDRIRWLPCKNGNSGTIPAYSAVRITDVIDLGHDKIYVVDKPNLDGALLDAGRGYAFTGRKPIQAGKYGRMSVDFPLYAAYGSLPTAGQEVGIANNSWTISTSQTGFRVVGDVGNGRCLIVPREIAGSATPVRFELTATLAIGGTAAARIVRWDGAAYVADGAVITVEDFTAAPGMFRGVSGYRGWAIPLADSVNYEIIYMEHLAALVAFTLTSTFSAGIATATQDDFWQGKQPGATISVYDTQNLYASKPVGSKGVASYDEISDVYRIIDMGGGGGGMDLTVAYLDEDLAEGASAAATVMEWDGDSWEVTGAAITVHDVANFGDAPQGSRVWCELSASSGRYEVVSLDREAAGARRLEFTVVQPMAKNEIGTVVEVTLFYDGIAPFAPPGELFVQNSRHIFECETGKRGVAVYKPELGVWEIDWVECSDKKVQPSYPPDSSPPPDTYGTGGPPDGFGYGNYGNTPFSGAA